VKLGSGLTLTASVAKHSKALWAPVLLALSLAIWRHPLGDTFRLARAHEEYTHILLVLPLTFALLYIGWREFSGPRQGSIGLGVSFFVAALVIEACAKWRLDVVSPDVRLSLSMLALVTFWIGSLICCFGRRFVRVSLLALFLLVFIVPLPKFALSATVRFLQNWSAFSAQIMFRAIGTPVTQDGVMLSIPGLDLEVARECSSIRSSMMLILTTIVLAQLFLRSGWRKALLVLAAIPLSFLKNGFRIFVLAEIGTRFYPGVFDGRLHHQGGIVFLSVAVGVVVLLLWGLRRSESSKQQNHG